MPKLPGPMPESGLCRATTVAAPDCENPNQPIICARAMINEDFRELPAAGNAEQSRRRFLYCAKQGLLRHAVPTSQGGRGDSFSDLAEAHEALGKSTLDCGLLLSINAHLWGALFPLLEYGAQSQKQDWLESLLSGRLIGGHAITEPQAGSDLNALETLAEAGEDGFVLNGRKRYITNAPIADLLVVYAKLENRLTGFIVQRGDSGANFTDAPAVVGCRSATMGDVELDRCRIPRSRLLGKPGGGQMMIQHALELERAFVFAGFAGVMEGQLEAVLKHSR
ncbi:MAG: acyl-CoA dehydrogenase family protein, partial [Gammaproteobacteria bacterium]